MKMNKKLFFYAGALASMTMFATTTFADSQNEINKVCVVNNGQPLNTGFFKEALNCSDVDKIGKDVSSSQSIRTANVVLIPLELNEEQDLLDQASQLQEFVEAKIQEVRKVNSNAVIMFYSENTGDIFSMLERMFVHDEFKMKKVGFASFDERTNSGVEDLKEKIEILSAQQQQPVEVNTTNQKGGFRQKVRELFNVKNSRNIKKAMEFCDHAIKSTQEIQSFVSTNSEVGKNERKFMLFYLADNIRFYETAKKAYSENRGYLTKEETADFCAEKTGKVPFIDSQYLRDNESRDIPFLMDQVANKLYASFSVMVLQRNDCIKAVKEGKNPIPSVEFLPPVIKSYLNHGNLDLQEQILLKKGPNHYVSSWGNGFDVTVQHLNAHSEMLVKLVDINRSLRPIQSSFVQQQND